MAQLNNYTFKQYFEYLPKHIENSPKLVTINLHDQRSDTESEWDLSDDENKFVKKYRERPPCPSINCCHLFIVIFTFILFVPSGIIAAKILYRIQRVGIACTAAFVKAELEIWDKEMGKCRPVWSSVVW